MLKHACHVTASTQRGRTLCYASKNDASRMSSLHDDERVLRNYKIVDYSTKRVDGSGIGNQMSLRGLAQLDSFDEQARHLYASNRVDESGTRVRFFVASLVEEKLSDLFDECLCLPFGSSVNKLGCKWADLDINVALKRVDHARQVVFNVCVCPLRSHYSHLGVHSLFK